MMRSQIHVMVVEVPMAEAGSSSAAGSRVKELLADADPFIAGLIKKLQAEVKAERQQMLAERFRQREMWVPRDDAQPPLGQPPIDFELPADDEEDWPLLHDLERYE